MLINIRKYIETGTSSIENNPMITMTQIDEEFLSAHPLVAFDSSIYHELYDTLCLACDNGNFLTEDFRHISKSLINNYKSIRRAKLETRHRIRDIALCEKMMYLLTFVDCKEFYWDNIFDNMIRTARSVSLISISYRSQRNSGMDTSALPKGNKLTLSPLVHETLKELVQKELTNPLLERQLEIVYRQALTELNK